LCSTRSCALLVQALVKVLYDMMHQLAYSTPAQKPQMPYSDIGLPITDLHMLRIEFMSVIQKCLTSQTERLAFGAQTLPLCANWLVTLASSGMRSYAEGQDVMAGRKGLSNLAVGYSDVVGKHFFGKQTAFMQLSETIRCVAKLPGSVHWKLHCVCLEPLTMFCLTCS